MTNEQKTEHVGIRVEPSIKKAAEVTVKREGSTLSEEIRKLLKRLARKANK